MALQNVVVVGAGGKLGYPLVQSLLKSILPKFNTTVLARSSSVYTRPEGVDPERLKVIKVDMNNHADLVDAMKDQDALVLTMTANQELAPTSLKLIDAAVEAGVKLVIPSDFGNDDHPLVDGVFRSKKVVSEYLEKVAAANKVTYTAIRNGPWFDLAIKVTLGVDFASKKAIIYDEGDRKSHTTTVDSVCQAILSILSNPGPYQNKIVHIHDFFITQQELLSAVENVTAENFEKEKVDVHEAGRIAAENLKRGEFTQENVLGVLRQSVWGVEGSARWNEADDSADLGLGQKTLEGEVRKLVA